jgi:hypothetical protein
MTNLQCVMCAHYEGHKRCLAFPDGIPNSIWYTPGSHREPVEGDHGYQYTPLDAAAPAKEATR